MADFDPDAYLKEKAQAGGFDPDAYLQEKLGAAAVETPGSVESGLRGLAQGASLGFADELAGAGGALLAKLRGDGRSLGDAYRAERDDSRAHYAAADKAHHGLYLGGNLAGGLATALIPGAGAGGLLNALRAGMALGAAGGLGGSSADLTKGEVLDAAKDTAIGAGLGAAGGAVGHGVSRIPAGLGRLSELLSDKAKLLAASAVKATAGEYKGLGTEGAKDIGEWLLKNKALKFGDTFHDLAPRVEALRGEAGKRMSSVLSEAEKAGARVDPKALAQRFLDAALEAEKYGPAAKDQAKMLFEAAAQVEAEGAKLGRHLTPAEAESWKQGYQAAAYPRGRAPIDPRPDQVAAMELARHAKEVTEGALDKAASERGLGEVFRSAKKDYGSAAQLFRMLEGAEGRSGARNLAAPSDKLAALATLASGHNPLVAAGAGVLNNQVRTRAASSSAVASQGLSELLRGFRPAARTAKGGAGELLTAALQALGADGRNSSGLPGVALLPEVTQEEQRKRALIEALTSQ